MPLASSPRGRRCGTRVLSEWLERAQAAGWEKLLADQPPARAILAPWLASAEAWLKRSLHHSGHQVLPSARRDFVELLARRLSCLCLQVLTYEQQALRVSARPSRPHSGLDASPTRWRHRLEEFPELAHVIARSLLSWQRTTLELLARLEADAKLLANTLLDGRPLPPLAGVEGGAGDPHDGGRSVAVLRFAGGHRIVYKPKDLRITRAVLDLCAFLNTALRLPLHVRTVLPHRGYAWEEFIPAAPCHTAAEVEHFYIRMGMLLRLFQLLEAQDLMLENLVAAGEHPVFVDLETVLQPRRRIPARARALEELMRESVLPLGLLAAHVRIAPGLAAEDISALTPPRDFLSPLPSVPAHAVLEGAEHRARSGYRLWEVRAQHAPTLEGKPTRAAEHLGALLEGYRHMQAALCARRQALLAPGSPLERLAGLPVRYLHRSSWDYVFLALTSLAPARMSALGQRVAALETWLHLEEATPEERPVLHAEVSALAAVDLPSFLCKTDGQALLGCNGRVLREGFFSGTAMKRVRRRLREVERFDLDHHESLVRSVLATGHHSLLPPPASGTREEPDVEGNMEVDWRAEALRLGALLLEQSHPDGGGGLTWLGLSYDPLHDVEQVQPLEPELLSGTAGIALVLAEFYGRSGQERFRDAALRALVATCRSARQWRDGVARGSSDGLGAFRGVGAWLYTLSRCAVLLEAPELEHAAQDCILALPRHALRARDSHDIITGPAGLLLALSACGAEAAARHLTAELEHAWQGALLPCAPLPVGSQALRHLPSLLGGLVLCASRLSRRFGFSPRWTLPELERPSGPGDLLVRLELTRVRGTREPSLREELLRLLRAPSGHYGSAGRLDALEVALTAATLLEDEEFLVYARRWAEALLSEYRRHGKWFPDSLAADRHRCSAIWGVAAIAHGFLRLDARGRLPSLRLLAT